MSGDQIEVFETKQKGANRAFGDPKYDFAEKVKRFTAAIDAYKRLDEAEQAQFSETHKSLQTNLAFLTNGRWSEDKIALLNAVIAARSDLDLRKDDDWLKGQQTLIEEAKGPDQSPDNAELLAEASSRIDSARSDIAEFTGKMGSRRTILDHMVKQVIDFRQGNVLNLKDLKGEKAKLEREYNDAALGIALKHFCLATVHGLTQSDIEGGTLDNVQVRDGDAAFNLTDHFRAWQDDPRRRILPDSKKLSFLVKELHLGLMTVKPSEYLLRFRKQTKTLDYPDPPPTGVSLDLDSRFPGETIVGKIDPDEIEKALNEALALVEKAMKALQFDVDTIDSADTIDSVDTIDHSERIKRLRRLYQVYGFYAHKDVVAAIERFETEPREALQAQAKLIDEALTDEQLSTYAAEEIAAWQAEIQGFDQNVQALIPGTGRLPPSIDAQNTALKQKSTEWNARLKRRSDFVTALPAHIKKIEGMLGRVPPEATDAKAQIEHLFSKYGDWARNQPDLKNLHSRASALIGPQQAYQELRKWFDGARQRARDKDYWQQVVDKGVNQFASDWRSTEPQSPATLSLWRSGHAILDYAQAVVQYLTCLREEKKGGQMMNASTAIAEAVRLVDDFEETLGELDGNTHTEITTWIDASDSREAQEWSWADLSRIEVFIQKVKAKAAVYAQEAKEHDESNNYWDKNIKPLITELPFKDRKYREVLQAINEELVPEPDRLRERLVSDWVADVREKAGEIARDGSTDEGLIEAVYDSVNFLINDEHFASWPNLPRLRRIDNEISLFLKWLLPFYIKYFREQHAIGLRENRGPSLNGAPVPAAGVPLSVDEYARWAEIFEEWCKLDIRVYEREYGTEADEVGGYLLIRQMYKMYESSGTPLDEIANLLDTSNLSLPRPRRQMLVDALLVLTETQILKAGLGKSKSGQLLNEMSRRTDELDDDLQARWVTRVGILSAYAEGQVETLNQFLSAP